jgi:hypothetical protein
MGLGTLYHNNYLVPTLYNLQQSICITAIQWNVSIYIKMHKQTNKNGERIKQRDIQYIQIQDSRFY